MPRLRDIETDRLVWPRGKRKADEYNDLLVPRVLNFYQHERVRVNGHKGTLFWIDCLAPNPEVADLPKRFSNVALIVTGGWTRVFVSDKAMKG